ncbi:Putative aminoglycoside phosphotransferase [Defluviimonas aquaemixtae]|uniref:Aminoglycoside phosphotransferase n=1 Tax=Albidovulum aquaemixtae TaxID=1542388 RepID=A0A2R8B3U7_9RHOB|nr:phosphotransferase family protein [Defluviimonas aquaemixtae]SPH17200.1 Putative aminoglycoside phosphotransferase [Defluviimonas aquaemixtae]
MATHVEFDQARLKSYLDGRFGKVASCGIERVTGGQSNPTYFVTHGTRRMVLRKQPDGPILPGAHAIDREFRVLRALLPTDVPVPRPILFHDDPDLIGTPFYLMERVEGRVFGYCALPEVPVVERRALWMGLAEAMARLHVVRPDDVGLGDYGRPGNYFERQIGRWTRQWRDSASEPIPEIGRLAEWLPANLPEDDGAVSIAHGDFRMGNMIFDRTKPQVAAILDWELSTLGHPLADLGFCALAWHLAPDEYGGIRGLDLAAEGLPSEDEFVRHYMTCCPGASPLLPFHKAFALFRFAVIFVGIADRVRQGTAAAANAADVAPLARRCAMRGIEVIDGGGR